MTLRVLLVDDEALARARLKRLLADCTSPGARVVAEAADAAQALQCVLQHEVDAVLADIHMPGVDGLSLAASLRHLPQAPVLVFVTAYAEHALQAFDLDAVDYLTKPVRLERLQTMLQKIQRTISINKGLNDYSDDEVLVIQERARTERVPLASVLYLKAELKYITVRTAAHSYLLEGALSELEARYASRFVRIHRNALVARRAVRSLEKHFDALEGDGWAVRLDGIDEALWVSRRQLTAVRALLAGTAHPT
ncbi:MAG: response regulator transcription factor [Rhodoferax sp.]|uniref:LytR/AlgR family response regulator transcription factor n=1 Tax=Rhodoferax sp. TaxID=50421 RepID=UPI001B5F3BBF|nr:LytTR family DNA-binding domain-containing protein [Rhodoferax sp.]MBP9904251.1 response regulator transcription factor [Rhodoferax sp.]